MPINIKINENDHSSVYGVLSDWAELVQKEKDSMTRKVLVEKFSSKQRQKQQMNEILDKWNYSGLLDGLHIVLK